jgi:hypothetical protein
VTDPNTPHRYRVTAPGRTPRFFHTRWLAYDYSRHTNNTVTHVRDIHRRDNGTWATGPWRELETSNT